jgi:hypothetical protein
MKKVLSQTIQFVVCVSFLTLLVPPFANGLESIKVGENSEFTTYGWFRNNLGMFFEKQPFQENGNQLATARTWLRAYGDLKLGDNVRFWTAIQFVHEPWYAVDEGTSSSRVPIQRGEPTFHDGKEYSEYDNINDVVREAYVEWKPNKQNSIKFGRQIAIWGEALTSRVGDVIHPDDLRFSLTFANLEDTRIPLWMVRGVHNIDSLLSSFEWIVSPNFSQGNFLVNRLPSLSAGGAPGQRFAIGPEMRARPPRSIGVANFVIAAPVSYDFPVIPSLRNDYPGDSLEDMRGGFRTNTTLGG